jgi:hypothetical protein
VPEISTRQIGVTIIVLGCVAGSLALGTSQTQAHYDLKGKHCKPVSHAPNSDWVSTNIKVRNLRCRTARYWLRRDKGDWWGVPWRNCTRRVKQSGDAASAQAHTDYKCKSPNGRQRLVWVNY